MTNKEFQRRTVVIEQVPGDGWLMMDEVGRVALKADAKAAHASVLRQDSRRTNKTGISQITTIKWSAKDQSGRDELAVVGALETA